MSPDATDPLVKAGRRARHAHQNAGVEVRYVDTQLESARADDAPESPITEAPLNSLAVALFVAGAIWKDVELFDRVVDALRYGVRKLRIVVIEVTVVHSSLTSRENGPDVLGLFTTVDECDESKRATDEFLEYFRDRAKQVVAFRGSQKREMNGLARGGVQLGIDDYEVAAYEARQMTVGIRDRCRGADERRLALEQPGGVLESSEEKCCIRAEDPGVVVHLVDDDQRKTREKPPDGRFSKPRKHPCMQDVWGCNHNS